MKFQIRDNYNGRIINWGVREFDSVNEALQYGFTQQEKRNKQFRESKPKRGPCPTVEVLQVIWTGIPERVKKESKA